MSDLELATWNDTNADGVGDSAEMDTDRDGYVDTTVLDSDFNGQIDVVGYDTDRNGLSNIIDLDTDRDGVLDSRMVDVDGNGLMDRFAGPATDNVQIVLAEPQPQPYDPGMGVIGGGGTNPLLNSEVIMNDPYGRDAVIKIMDSQNDMIKNILDDDDDDD